MEEIRERGIFYLSSICQPVILLVPDAVGQAPRSLDEKIAFRLPIFLCFLFLQYLQIESFRCAVLLFQPSLLLKLTLFFILAYVSFTLIFSIYLHSLQLLCFFVFCVEVYFFLISGFFTEYFSKFCISPQIWRSRQTGQGPVIRNTYPHLSSPLSMMRQLTVRRTAGG